MGPLGYSKIPGCRPPGPKNHIAKYYSITNFEEGVRIEIILFSFTKFTKKRGLEHLLKKNLKTEQFDQKATLNKLNVNIGGGVPNKTKTILHSLEGRGHSK